MKSYKLITIAVVIGLCGFILVIWRVIDKPSVQRGKDIVQTRQAGNPLFPMFSTTETKQEPGDQASFFIPQGVPQEEQARYPEKVTEALQVAKEGTATREQLQDGMTSLREEATKRRENGKGNEAMELEDRAIQLEVKEMELKARAMERERESQNP